MSLVFNADDNDVPFFGSAARPKACLAFSSAHSEAHVPGRHLNAMLNAQDAAGIELDQSAIDKHRRAAMFSFSGPMPLPMNRQTMDGTLVNFMPHNVREGMHALYALVCFRGDEQAQRMAEACIEAIFDCWNADTGWSISHDDVQVNDLGFILGLARALGPLVKYHRTTGSTSALQLAHVIRDKLLDEAFVEDGRYDRDVHGTHTHSTTCVMSSLAQLAELEDDASLYKRVEAFYRNGLKDISDELGWVIEHSRDESDPDRGECNNTGDIVETALILGRHVDPYYFEDAERMVRSHLLPAQLRDAGFIVQPPNPKNEDGLRDLADRHQGAFGFPAPYGHEPINCPCVSFNMDIVGGAVGSLCEVVRAMSEYDGQEHRVNLLFDHETDAIRVESPYTHDALRITLKQSGRLRFSPRSWAAIKEGMTMPPPREITLRHRTRDIRAHLRGDAVVAMDNFDADLTYFDPVED
jgi:hypothetical protein